MGDSLGEEANEPVLKEGQTQEQLSGLQSNMWWEGPSPGTHRHQG